VATRSSGAHSAATPRRRRTREEARGEILDAARTLLAERPSQEVTVMAVMARTTLSRKSFYVYFRDRGDLFAALIEPLRIEADRTLARWRESSDIVGAGRAALYSAGLMYARHGTLLRALANASDTDEEAARVWREVQGAVVAAASQKIAEATATGESEGLDPESAARALVAMNVQVFFDQLVRKRDPDVGATVRTLATIWERTIYLRAPQDGELRKALPSDPAELLGGRDADRA
jgi:AcrR family transcriptional regulator